MPDEPFQISDDERERGKRGVAAARAWLNRPRQRTLEDGATIEQLADEPIEEAPT